MSSCPPAHLRSRRESQRSPAPSAKSVAAHSHRAHKCLRCATGAAAVSNAISVKRSSCGLTITQNGAPYFHSCAIIARSCRSASSRKSSAESNSDTVKAASTPTRPFWGKTKVLPPVPTPSPSTGGYHVRCSPVLPPKVDPADQFRSVLLVSKSRPASTSATGPSDGRCWHFKSGRLNNELEILGTTRAAKWLSSKPLNLTAATSGSEHSSTNDWSIRTTRNTDCTSRTMAHTKRLGILVLSRFRVLTCPGQSSASVLSERALGPFMVLASLYKSSMQVTARTLALHILT